MPKMEAASLTIKISLDQIIDTGNIREISKYGPGEKGEYPEEIRELAQSIKATGQLQAINVKAAGELDGAKQYELIAGFRRRAAFQYLCSIGEDFRMIDAKIVTGDKLTIQLVENIQREDLTAPEREAAIFRLAENGMKQSEIAVQLSKGKSFVSVNISAHKMRVFSQKANIDLSGVETSTLAELLSVPDSDLIEVLRELVRRGGTRTAANSLAAKYKKGKELPPPEPVSTPPSVTPSGADTTPDKEAGLEPDIDPLAGVDIVREYPQAEPPKEKPVEKPQEKPGNVKSPEHDPIEAEHGIIDANVVFTAIYEYMESIKKQIAGNWGKDDKTGLMNRLEAAKDILALIHKRLDNA